MDNVNKIITLLENGQHEEAIKGYKKILQDGSNEERLVLGEELFSFGFLEEARSLFEKLLEVYPEEGELLVLLAETCIDLGEEEKALLTLERIVPTHPSYPQSLLLQADLYQMQGLYEVSEQKLLHAKSILPEEIIIDFALGELYLEQGRFIQAIHSYNKVLEEKEEVAGVNVYQRLGDAYSAGGAFEEALPHYQKALEDRLEINTLFNYGLTAYQAGFNKVAIQKFIELKEYDPEYHSVYLYLAKAYEKEEEYDKSFEAVVQGIRHDEYNKELFLFGGKIALKLGKEDEAEKMLRQAIALDPEFIEAGLLLNKLLLHQENYDGVLEIIDLLGKNGVVEPQFLWDEAVALSSLEKYSEALNKYQQAYNFFKDTIEFLTDYGYFLLEEGKNQEAAEVFSKLLEKDPTNDEYVGLLQRLTAD